MNEKVFMMNLLQVAIPMIIVTVLVVLMLARHFDNEARKRSHESNMNGQRTVLPIRLQAYERLVLFLERISINNLILRVKQPGMDAADLQAVLIIEIRNEFEHNISQQIYVSPETWEVVKNAKEEIVKMVHIAYSMLPEEADAMALSRVIFDLFMKQEHPPTYTAILHIKREAADLF